MSIKCDQEYQPSTVLDTPESIGEDIILYKRDSSSDVNPTGYDKQEEISSSYSSYLNYLFGTEESVNLRRQLVILREKLWNIQLRDRARVVCGGSLGEGVAYPSSDDDAMMYRTCYRVVKTIEDGSLAGDLLMALVGGNPGYCLLYEIQGSYIGDCSRNTLFCYKGRPLVSSSQVKESFLTTAGGDRIHGPCSTFAIGSDEYDQAFSIPCSFWPVPAQEWLNRRRSYGWPSREMIQKIESGKCHVVPIGNPDSPLNEHEWRISFLVGERMLMHSFNHSQFLTYNLLRTALKKKIETEMEDVLCSYFMKTILFFTIENTTRQTWMLNNLEVCFQKCLSMLYDCIDVMNLPSYFIPENNLIQRKVNDTNRPRLLQCLQSLQKDGIMGVLNLCMNSENIEKYLCFSEMEWKQDKDFLHSNHLSKLLGLIEAEISQTAVYPIESYVSASCNTFGKCLKGDESSTSFAFSGILNGTLYAIFCLKLMHDSYREQKENKDHVHRRIESLLESIPQSDVSTSLLTMATSLYYSGKPECALSTTRKFLSEYPPYVIDELLKRELNRETYKEILCGRGYTIDYKASRAWAPLYSMPHFTLNAFPHPLKILIKIGKHLRIHPITFALFLECLCCIQMEDRFAIMKATKCLVQQVHDLDNSYGIVCVRMCVGIIKYVQGDKQSAWRWLGSAYIMKKQIQEPLDERISLSALTYMACLINKSLASV